MIDLVEGVRRHRAFGRRSKSAYDSHLSNAIHFAAIRDGAEWVVEPLGWALLVARGGNPELETEGDGHGDGVMQFFVDAGWTRIDEGAPAFDRLWNSLNDRLSVRGIGLSARKGVRAVFWAEPDSLAI